MNIAKNVTIYIVFQISFEEVGASKKISQFKSMLQDERIIYRPFGAFREIMMTDVKYSKDTIVISEKLFLGSVINDDFGMDGKIY